MTNDNKRMIADQFYHAFMTHKQVDAPSTFFPDISYEEAYDIQKIFIEKLKTNEKFHICGKKVGLTSKAMRKVSGINEPDYGYIFSDRCFTNGSIIPLDLFVAPRIECELAFRLKKDLNQKKVSVEDVINATEYVVCCMEICDFRMFRDKKQRLVQDSICDDAAFGGYIIGDRPLDIRNVDLSLVPYAFEVNNRQVEVSSGAAVYDDPAASVAWLAERFYLIGEPLQAGELILSGSAVASVPVERGDHFRCQFGEFGEVSCTFL